MIIEKVEILEQNNEKIKKTTMKDGSTIDLSISRTSEIDYSDMDSSIIKLIKLLNDNGFPTISCCSGMWRDHIDIRTSETDKKKLLEGSKKYCRYMNGHIVFDILTEEKCEQLIKVAYNSDLIVYTHYREPSYKYDVNCPGKYYCKEEIYYRTYEIRNPIPNIHKYDGDKRLLSHETSKDMDAYVREDIGDKILYDRWCLLKKNLQKIFNRRENE
jgi:hypothetical protein